MSDEADELIQKITDEVRSWDANVAPGSEDYMSDLEDFVKRGQAAQAAVDKLGVRE